MHFWALTSPPDTKFGISTRNEKKYHYDYFYQKE